MNKTKKTLIVFTLLNVLGIAIFVFNKANKAEAIAISPDKYKLEVGAGQTLPQNSTTLRLMPRTTDNNDKWYISILGMKKENEFHTRSFYIPNPEDMSGVANWISLGQAEFTIISGEDTVVPWTLTAPKEVTCGTHLAAIVISSTPQLNTQESANETIVSLGREIVSQVHVTITRTAEGPCENKAELNLLEFKIARDENNTNEDEEITEINKFLGKPVFNYDDVPFITRIENTGNLLAEKPKGYIDIEGIGDKITLDVNETDLDIYPETIRRFDNKWYETGYPHKGSFTKKLFFELSHFRFGKYKARLGLTKNVDNEITATIEFWIFPWRVIILFTIILIIIIAIISIIIYKKRKNKNRGQTSNSPPPLTNPLNPGY